MTDPSEWLSVESLDLEARGVAHNAEGKVVFIEGALPGEQVQARVSHRKNNWEQALLVSLRRESAQRVTPGCPYFGLHAGACGGCKVQHLHPAAQVAVKQRALEDALWHIGKVKPQQLLRPIEGPAWGYRYRARLSVRYVNKKGTVLVGFRERKSSYVTDMQSCAVLPPHVSALLMPLRALIGALDQRDRVPQIELAVGEAITALVLRHLEPLTERDRARLSAFAERHGVQWWLQAQGPDTVTTLDESGGQLSYTLPEFGITLAFRPTDFTQVNPHINRALVARALRLLDVQAGETVIDWFCGLGNFTLPLAARARSVLGIEGSAVLVRRAEENAHRNGLEHKARFQSRDLTEMPTGALAGLGAVDKWMIDPPREGALALVKALADLTAASSPGWQPPHRIVYVSCNPATLARDAALLVHQAGYRCTATGVVNMFPHTAHVESIAVFDRD
ncbi:MAG: 23S rRNA (uracil(1939)-C(5))-methyltransferase RlmD [Burkholderiaceae bacterium]|nr:23S rRNA (uracil(1939)-C(5))-methyltransferase RlmD [Burkholderiaceae bacterium]MDH3460174.1 23S rRNA (uracil(1939)-C(5))-methyltransferase RlmD [Burkholderiaceae bacterium]